MKEVVLRILHSTKEPIIGMSRRKSECVFHFGVHDAETLLQEEINCGLVVSLRVRQLSNPPPEMMARDSYKTVTKLELSCPIEVSWVFSVTSVLPGLQIVRFGSSCFEYPYGDCKPLSQSWLTKCPSVNELKISFDHQKLLQEDFDSNGVILVINSILEQCTKYFTNLVKADLYLPFGVKLEEFLRNNPLLAETGEKRPRLDHAMIHFLSHSYNDKRKNFLPRRDSDPPPSIILGQSVVIQDPRRRPLPLKRGHSITSEMSSEPEEDPDIPFRSPKNRPYLTPSTPSPVTIKDSLHDTQIPSMIDYNPSYYRRNSSNTDSHSSASSTSPPPVIESYSDFSQMFTRRR